MHTTKKKTTKKHIVGKMAQDVGMVWKYCGVILILFGPFLWGKNPLQFNFIQKGRPACLLRLGLTTENVKYHRRANYASLKNNYLDNWNAGEEDAQSVPCEYQIWGYLCEIVLVTHLLQNLYGRPPPCFPQFQLVIQCSFQHHLIPDRHDNNSSKNLWSWRLWNTSTSTERGDHSS